MGLEPRPTGPAALKRVDNPGSPTLCRRPHSLPDVHSIHVSYPFLEVNIRFNQCSERTHSPPGLL
jgi:hypothetical protein